MKPKIIKTKTTYVIMRYFVSMVTVINFLWVLVAFLFGMKGAIGTSFFGFIVFGGILAVYLSAKHHCYISSEKQEYYEEFITHKELNKEYQKYKHKKLTK